MFFPKFDEEILMPLPGIEYEKHVYVPKNKVNYLLM